MFDGFKEIDPDEAEVLHSLQIGNLYYSYHYAPTLWEWSDPTPREHYLWAAREHQDNLPHFYVKEGSSDVR